jgi:hypothetical protein
MPPGDLRFDSASATCRKNPAACRELVEAQTSPQSLAATASRASPGVLAVLPHDGADDKPQDTLEEHLVDCARLADQDVNRKWFGDRDPTDAECREVVELEVDGCTEFLTRAMALGREKHAAALECADKALKELWKDGYSLEQRYRYYMQTQLLEAVSAQEEARLLAQGCTKELWRTIKPDIVLHLGGNLHLVCRTFDFKFPCLKGKEPEWTEYGEKSAFSGFDQGYIYEKALGCKPVIIWRKGVLR